MFLLISHSSDLFRYFCLSYLDAFQVVRMIRDNRQPEVSIEVGTGLEKLVAGARIQHHRPLICLKWRDLTIYASGGRESVFSLFIICY